MESNPKLKRCSKCGETKPFSEFFKNKSKKEGINSWCKVCSIKDTNHRQKVHRKRCNEYSKKWQKNNYEKHKKSKAKCVSKNSSKYKETSKRWKQNNFGRMMEKKKVWELNHPGYHSEYTRNNLERARLSHREYDKKRRLTPRGRLDDSMSSQIYLAIRGNKAGRSWELLVGYTVGELHAHLESKFTDGMSWDNYGKDGWAIDHIVPKARFHYEHPEDQEFRVCWALANLQPLWAKDNCQKNDRTMEEWEQYKTQRVALGA